MNIGPHNYEAWLLDRMEGRLDAEQEKALDQFLKANPGLAVERGALPTATGDGIAFPGKEGLKRDFPPTGLPNAARINDFLVAHLHNELDAVQEEALVRYLYEHPEYSRDAALVAKAEVPAVPVHYPGKEHLRKQFPPQGMPDAHRLDDFLVALIEGDLSAEQRKEVELMVQRDPAVRRRRDLLQVTKVPAVPLHFPWKEELKKTQGRVVFLWPRVAAAASVLLLVTLGLWLRQPRESGPIVAERAKTHLPAAPPRTDAQATAPEAMKPAQMNEGSEQAAPEMPAPSRHPRTQAERPRAHALEEQLPAPPEMAAGPEHLAVDAEGPKPAGAEPVAPFELPAEDPALAAHVETTPVADRTTAPETGQTLANVVREHILKQPARNDALDATDALLIADKTLNAVTKGGSSLDIQKQHGRERFKLRVGDNFSISASRAVR